MMNLTYIKKIINFLSARGFFNFLNDERYIKLKFWAKIGTKLDLNNPKTYNEKLQWLKLYYRNPLYSKLVDKYEVKEYVKKIIGEEYIIQTLGVWDKFSQINFKDLPERFVLKCTHDSGGISIIKNKSRMNVGLVSKKINKSLKKYYYKYGREWPYKDVKQRIIAEQYMEDEKFHELRDYKFFCFEGEPKYMYVASNRHGEGDTYFDFYDMEYNHLDLVNGHPNAPIPPEKPENFEKMIELARKLSQGFLHIRVDFYEVNGKVYFGELTFYHMSGLAPFEPEEWDYKFGEEINLKKIKS